MPNLIKSEKYKKRSGTNTKMKATDKYHRWVEWSEEDQTYVGKCPDLFLGGCHGNNPIDVAKELQEIIDEWETIFADENKPLPPAKIRPMTEVA